MAPLDGLRPLEIGDFQEARKKISPSYTLNSLSHEELKKWNETYGDGTKMNNSDMTYYN